MGTAGRPAATAANAALRRESKRKVLEALEAGYSIGYAAEQGGIHRETVLYWRNNDPEFAAAWAHAWERGADWMEDKLREQIDKGVPVSTIVGLKMRHRFVEKEDADPEKLAQAILSSMRQLVAQQQKQLAAPDNPPEPPDSSIVEGEEDGARNPQPATG